MKRVWKKASAEAVERFARVLPASPLVERRTMFGYPCAFVRGNMFTGLFEDSLFVRLPAEERAAFLARGEGRPFEAIPGRVMKEYAVLNEESGDEAAAKSLLRRALAYAKTLPEKSRSPRHGRARRG